MKAVAGAIAAIEKQFGKGAIMALDGGDESRRSPSSPPAPSGSTSRSASAASRAGG